MAYTRGTGNQPLRAGAVISAQAGFLVRLWRQVLASEMRTGRCQNYSRGDLGRSFVAAVTILSSITLCPIARSSVLTDEEELLALYRELRLVESESIRVAVTIDALEAELHEQPYQENVEQIHSRLGRLYKYDVHLASHYRDLNEVWSYLQDPEGEIALSGFNADQSRPIPTIQTGVYEGLPDDAIPITDYSPITVETIHRHLLYSKK